MLKLRHLVQVKRALGISSVGSIFALTEAGRERAREYLEANQYAGPGAGALDAVCRTGAPAAADRRLAHQGDPGQGIPRDGGDAADPVADRAGGKLLETRCCFTVSRATARRF